MGAGIRMAEHLAERHEKDINERHKTLKGLVVRAIDDLRHGLDFTDPDQWANTITDVAAMLDDGIKVD